MRHRRLHGGSRRRAGAELTMARITVLRPDVPLPPAPRVALARRGELGEGGVLTLVENGKPHARELLELIGTGLRLRLGLGAVEVFSKPSASQPIDADEARLLAARSRLVLTGVGD
jgi:hypothetical protein